MSQLQKIYDAVRFIGLDSMARSIVYARRRSQIERRYTPLPATPLIPPGDLFHSEIVPGGGRFSFKLRSLEVQFLDLDVVRLNWDNAAPPPPYGLADKQWPGANPSVTQTEGGYRLTTNALELSISKTGAMTFATPTGQTLASFSEPLFSERVWRLAPTFQPDERIYGLGERAISVDRRGHSLTLWNTEVGGSYHANDNPLYLNIPMWMGVHTSGGYLAFIENPFRSQFNLGKNSSIEFYDGALQMYFIRGLPSKSLPRFLELTGKPPLPPRWSLGYHQSRWGYKNEQDIRNLVAAFEDNDLPIHAVHLDIDYMRGYRVFTIDPTRFPNLKRLSQDMAEKNVKLVTILDPGVKVDPGYSVYQNGVETGVFCKMPDGQEFNAPVWPGWCAFPDFTAPKTRAWWSQLYSILVENGIAGFWHDMNEPSTFAAWGDATMPMSVRHDLEGRKGDHHEAHNLYGLLMNRAACEGLRALRPHNRPWMVTRSAWAGIGRYAWKWSGDVAGTWEMLRGTLALLLGLSMSGVYFVGSDIGGFSNHPTPELYTRWFQMASFTPFFRTHSATGLPSREPWCFGDEVLKICREALKLRTRLLPYYYTLAWQAAVDGVPILRPLFWNEPHQPALCGVDDAFLLGDRMLLAPILDQGKDSRSLHLPPGHWYDYYSGQDYSGDQTIQVSAPLERIPLFVKAGSVIPFEEGRRLELHVYAPNPDEIPDPSILYSDAGDGYEASRLDTFNVLYKEDRLVVDWKSEGEYAWPYERLEWVLHGFQASAAIQDGKPCPVQANRFSSDPLNGISFT